LIKTSFTSPSVAEIKIKMRYIYRPEFKYDIVSALLLRVSRASIICYLVAKELQWEAKFYAELNVQ
jgi:hypothetical protein